MATRWYVDGGTVLPDPLARLVSKTTKGVSMGTTAGFYATLWTLEALRAGSSGTVGLFQRLVEDLINKANNDHKFNRWAICGSNLVANSTTLALFLTSFSYHLAFSTISRCNNMTQDFIYVVNAVFGSTETSRAIRSLLSLGHQELTRSNVQPLHLGFSIFYFSMLQSICRDRTVQQIESHILWDVAVLATGEIVSHQLPSSGPFDDGTEVVPKSAFMKYIPKGADYRITIDEESTRVVTIQFTSEAKAAASVLNHGQGASGSKRKLPKGARIISEEVQSTSLGNNTLQFHYTLKFEERHHGFTERKGRTAPLEHTPSTRSPSLIDANAKEQDVVYSIANNANNGSVSTNSSPYATESGVNNKDRPLLNIPVDPMDGPMDGTVPEPMNLTQPTHMSEKLSSIRSHLPRLRTRHHHRGVSASSNISTQSLSHSPAAETNTSAGPVMTSATLPQQFVHVDSDGREISHQFGAGNNGVAALRSVKRKSSMSSLQSYDEGKTSAMQTPHDEYSTEAVEHSNNLMFPHGHLAFNMAKFVKFANAAYGESFLRVLGIASMTYRPTNEKISAQHYAFGLHTKTNPGDILDSSYSKESDIPLVYFVTYDHGARAIVLSLRGTLGFDDMLTDLSCEYESFEWQEEPWYAHKGMLNCAKILTDPACSIMLTLKKSLTEYPDYGLVLCGHSLGGGVVSLLGILLSTQESSHRFVTRRDGPIPGGRPIRCFCYGPPATISEPLRKRTRPLIVSVVYGKDIIPCLSLGLLRDFNAVAGETQKGQNLLKVLKLILDGAPREDYSEMAWNELERLRNVMGNEKLVPPGEVYHLQSSTILDRQDDLGKTREATRLVASIIVDVDKRFGAPFFGRHIIHHNPTFYEEGLNVLAQGLAEAPWAG